VRILGLETELAIQFFPAREGEARPTHEAVFRALLASLKARYRSCEALYYKGGEFLENGSLVHFEVGRLEDPTTGLLEFASPECLSAREALAYSKAQERAIVEAIPEAERSLSQKGYDGRIVALKNNRDRFGNDYGTHESYDVGERALSLGRRLVKWLLHPLVVLLVLAGKLILVLLFRIVLVLMLVVALLLEAVSTIRRLKGVAERFRQALANAATWAFEPGSRPGSGIVPRALFHIIKGAAWVYTLTARTFLFRGHIPELYPFLVTRQVVCGTGWLAPDGRFLLSARATALERPIGAYTYGRGRPIVDVKEFFFFRPWGYLAKRKRFHVLVGDANRSEYAEHLKLATTLAVLDALEAGALDETAARIELLGGPVAALRATAGGPASVVARDLASGEKLTAVQVQRRYLVATWDHLRSLPSVDPDTKEALVRWGFVLDQLEQDPLALDHELDWVLKKRLLDRTLKDELPQVGLALAWKQLEAAGPANAIIEELAPDLDLGEEGIELTLVERLGVEGSGRVTDALPREISWPEFARLRRAWLRLKVVDLRYHELSVEGGFFDWLAKDGLVQRVLADDEVARALQDPPQRTRARIRGDYVRNAGNYHACKVGWDRVVVEPRGERARTISLSDAYRFEV